MGSCSNTFSNWTAVIVLVAVGCARMEPEPEAGLQPDGSRQPNHTPLPALEDLPSELVGGAEVYNSKCELCHDKGEAGAPRLGNVKQWQTRVAQGEEVLTQHALEGFEGDRGEMPPQGGKLSAEDVGAAVKYMIYCYEQAQLEP